MGEGVRKAGGEKTYRKGYDWTKEGAYVRSGSGRRETPDLSRCANVLHHLEITQMYGKLEIGTQFPGSEIVQCNLEIAQIPRLSGAYTRTLT